MLYVHEKPKNIFLLYSVLLRISWDDDNGSKYFFKNFILFKKFNVWLNNFFDVKILNNTIDIPKPIIARYPISGINHIPIKVTIIAEIKSKIILYEEIAF